jgi:hypothetical protein
MVPEKIGREATRMNVAQRSEFGSVKQRDQTNKAICLIISKGKSSLQDINATRSWTRN